MDELRVQRQAEAALASITTMQARTHVLIDDWMITANGQFVRLYVTYKLTDRLESFKAVCLRIRSLHSAQLFTDHRSTAIDCCREGRKISIIQASL
jgi:hypothetical protein